MIYISIRHPYTQCCLSVVTFQIWIGFHHFIYVHVIISSKDDTRVPHVRHTWGVRWIHRTTSRVVILNFFPKKKFFLPLSPLCRDIPSRSQLAFFPLKKSNGKANEFVGDEDINAVFTIIWGSGKRIAGGGLNHRDGDLIPGLLQTSFRTEWQRTLHEYSHGRQSPQVVRGQQNLFVVWDTHYFITTRWTLHSSMQKHKTNRLAREHYNGSLTVSWWGRKKTPPFCSWFRSSKNFREKKNTRDHTVHRTCVTRVVCGEFTTREVVWCVILDTIFCMSSSSSLLRHWVGISPFSCRGDFVSSWQIEILCGKNWSHSETWHTLGQPGERR